MTSGLKIYLFWFFFVAGRLEREEDEAEDEDDGEEARMSFTGVKSSHRDRQLRQQELHAEERDGNDSDEDHDWEEMQIRKAMKKSQISETQNAAAAAAAQYYTLPSSVSNQSLNGSGGFSKAMSRRDMQAGGVGGLAKPVAYNLQGIKDRLKEK